MIDERLAATNQTSLIAENIYSKNSLLSRLLELMGVSKDTAEKDAFKTDQETYGS